MSDVSLVYPVVAFSSPTALNVYGTLEELTTCSKPALLNDFYKNLKIIDSHGRRSTVDNAVKLRSIGPFWGFNLFRGQQLIVELKFKEGTEQIELDDYKLKLDKLIKADRYSWDSGDDFNEILKIIENSNSIKDINQYLYKLFHTTYE